MKIDCDIMNKSYYEILDHLKKTMAENNLNELDLQVVLDDGNFIYDEKRSGWKINSALT